LSTGGLIFGITFDLNNDRAIGQHSEIQIELQRGV
jgi:hypothetical protein